jgi:peptidyl-prolyl cis-trans isomerase SurA
LTVKLRHTFAKFLIELPQCLIQQAVIAHTARLEARWGESMRPIVKLLLIFSITLLTALTDADSTVAESVSPFSAIVRVNEDVITGYDVEQRGQLIKFASGGRAKNVQSLAVQQLIQDSLKLQEAQRLGIKISDKELAQAMSRIAQGNRLKSTDELFDTLANAGIDADAFRSQIRVEVAWNRIMRQKFGARLTLDEGAIKSALEASTVEGPTVYDVRQILISLKPNASRKDAETAFRTAQRVRKKLDSCDTLMKLSPQYPPLSGRVGHLTAEQMPGPIRQKVLKLKTGGVTEPLRSEQGVHVIMLCGSKKRTGGSREQVVQRLQQEKAARLAESYIADLERNAIIEIRE